MNSLIHFERTGDSKESLDIGLKSVIHEGLKSFFEIHQSNTNSDISIFYIIISKKKNIEIYYDSIAPLYKYPEEKEDNPHDYFLSIFKKCGLAKYLTEESYYYNPSVNNNYQNVREYIIKENYKKYLVAETIYPNEGEIH